MLITFVCYRETSYSEFSFYASGRKNCFYAMFKLDLCRRHCLLSRYAFEPLYGSDDVLNVEIPIRFAGVDGNSPSPV